MSERKNIPYPKEVRVAIEKEVKKTGRSANQEIIYQLKKGLKIK